MVRPWIFLTLFWVFIWPAVQAQPIVVKPSQNIFVVQLDSNPTTGYSWYLADYNRSLLKPLAIDYRGTKTARVGAAGQMVWSFQILPQARIVPQVTEMKFCYLRPWEVNDQPTCQKFSVILLNTL